MPSVNSSFRSSINRGLTIALVLCLLSSSTPAAAQTIASVAKESSVSFLFWFRASGLSKTLQLQGAPNAGPQEKQADRDTKVSRLQIFPGDVTLDLSDHVRFSAVAYDRDGDPIGGVKIRWSGHGAAPQARVRVSAHGEFEAMTPGSFTITAQAGGKTAQVTVTVRAGLRRDLKATPIGAPREVSSRDLPAVKIGSAKEKKDSKSSAAKPRNRQGGSSASARRAHAAAAMPEPMPQSGGGGWDSTNYWSAGKPENRVADPPGASVDGGAGSGNFQFAAPVLSLPGRGINISLGLAYNSRLWNKANSQISYDNDRGWPAPGFNLGFGKLLGMGVYNGGMLVDADGTRHGYTGNITYYNWGTYAVLHTTDGSFIDYTYWSGTGGGIVSAQARLPNGTVISYGAAGPGAVYPTSIEDPNGNCIGITYVNNAGPRIQTVTDTLSRTISFSYDYNNLLTAITAPGYTGGTRTLVRLHYQQLALSYGFNGLTPAVRDSNPWMVDAIFYPGTSTGYWVPVSDSYSSYGMLAKVVEERGMGFSASSLNDMGSVSQGAITHRETYNYPLTPDYSLTDAPTYTSMLEEWTRDGVNFDSATTGYEAHDNNNPRSTVITLPNGTKSKQYSYNAPGQYNDGLVYHDVTYVTDENSPLQSSNSFWEPGAYNSPRPTRVEKTDERGQMTAAAFIYGSAYNQVTDVLDYDYGGATLLRSTHTTYQNSSNYTGTCYSSGCVGRHIFNLPLTAEIFDPNNNRLSRTEYQYDGQTLSATPNVVQHDQAFNPHAADEGYCSYEPDWSDGDCNGSCLPNCPECIQDPSCDGYCPQIWVCPYDGSTAFRGNVTQVTSYADATGLTRAVTETRSYDITGNMVTASTSCCQQTSFNYTIDTQYAYPLSKTRGSATDAYAQVTTSATYDFNTGLGKTATDANDRPSITDYDPNTLRPTTSTSPTGAHTDFAYDDVAMTATSTTYPTAGTGGAIADQNVKMLNGHGQVRQETALGAGNSWDSVDTIYDNMGQALQQTRPYRNGETQLWTATTYDALGRTTTVTAPDGSMTQTFYNEATRPSVASNSTGETTRVQDAWGRERWGRTDASGRLVEVVEPDPSSGGSVASNGLVTTYSYNTLGNLTQTNQGAQTRSFKYDSLGRLTAQKLAEQNATLNDAGTYVGSGTWSGVFTYDERSNLTSRTDARGVKTIYSYSSDPLNRLQSVSWDTSGFGDTASPILSAATVSYQYRTKASPSDLKDVTQLASLTTAGVSTETYGYDDGEGRVTSKTLTLTSRSDYQFATDYDYDSLDRAKNITYPKEYGNGAARKVVHHDYDIASRLTGLTFDGQTQASNIVYNAASQTTSLSAGTGTNQVNESYTYNSQTGLVDSQTATRNGSTLLNLSYDYTNSSGKRTGQLTKILNNLDHNKDRGYSYDALGRLAQATGGPSGSSWTQTYSYDRYGNRTSVSASGYSASNRGTSPTVREGAVEAQGERKSESRLDGTATGPINQPSDPKVDLPTDLLAKLELPTSARDDGQPLSDSPPRLRRADGDVRAPSTATSPPPSAPVFTDDPLVAGTTMITALHVSELRDAINQLRLRAGLSAASWAETVSAGVSLKAAHLTEMRARLEEARSALGLSPTSYTDPGLTSGYTVKAVHIQELRDSLKAAWSTSSQIPRDGLASVSYDVTSNRITTAGFAYDDAGNQTRALIPGSNTTSQRFQYDASNRLVKVKNDSGATIAVYTYGDSNERLISQDGDENSNYRTYYVGEGGSVTAEYAETPSSPTTPQWSKSYVYLGGRLLATLTPNGSGGEATQFHHPDRLGTRLVSDPQSGTSFEQVTLPFGTALGAESTGETNHRFTSYDRSQTTKLDYAVNRHYDPQQGRFTQVDPAGMKATSLLNPQTLNLYAYCTNDPINRTDPNGLGLISWLKKHWKIILVAVAIVVAVLLIPGAPAFLGSFFQHAGQVIISGAGAATEGGGMSTWLKVLLGASMALAIVGLGSYLQNGKVRASSDPLKDALDRARKALKRKACRDLFGSQAEKVQQLLEDFAKGKAGVGTIRMADLGGVRTDPTTGNQSITFAETKPIYHTGPGGGLVFDGVSITLNSNPAVNSKAGYGGRFGVSNEVNLAISLVHELAHAVDILSGSDGTTKIPDDTGNPELSKQNSQRVYDACFK